MSKKEPFSLESTLAEIRGIVDQMQRGVEDFDKQVALFKQGRLLIQQCQQYLDQSELEIKKLVDGNLEELAFRFSSENE
jgi:exodeoxyribonuclease VII small subunit